MSIECRTAVYEDLDDINLLFQGASKDGAAFSSRQEIIYQRILKEDMIDLLVVEKDQYVVACCHCAIVPTLANSGRSYAVVNHFLVDPLNRKQGHAKRLLEFAISYAKRKGCYQLYLVNDQPELWHQQFLSRYRFSQQGGLFR